MRQHEEIQDAQGLLAAEGVAAIAQKECLAPGLQQSHQADPAAT